METFSQDSQCPGQESNQAPPKYKPECYLQTTLCGGSIRKLNQSLHSFDQIRVKANLKQM
jgi:hypothetical protein